MLAHERQQVVIQTQRSLIHAPMDAGAQRWVFEQHGLKVEVDRPVVKVG